jgi:hypothetical protein
MTFRAPPDSAICDGAEVGYCAIYVPAGYAYVGDGSVEGRSSKAEDRSQDIRL